MVMAVLVIVAVGAGLMLTERKWGVESVCNRTITATIPRRLKRPAITAEHVWDRVGGKRPITNPASSLYYYAARLGLVRLNLDDCCFGSSASSSSLFACWLICLAS